MKRKLLSLTLVLALVLSLVPMGAFAALPTTLTTAGQAYVAANSTFSTMSDIVFTEAAADDIAAGNIVLTAPVGVQFNPTVTSIVVTSDKSGITFGTPVVSGVNNVTLTIPVSAVVAADGVAKITVSGVQVLEDSNAALATYNIASSGVVGNIAAAGVVTVKDLNQYTSILTVDKVSITADDSSTAEFTVYTYSADNKPVGGAAFYAGSQRGAATDTFTLTTGTALVAATSQFEGYTNAAGKAVFTVKTAAAGTFKVGVGLIAPGAAIDQQNYLNGVTTAGSVDAVALGMIATKDITAGSDGTNGIATFGAATLNPVGGPVKANNLDYYEYSFRVTTTAGAPVSGQKVTFSASDAAVVFSANEKTTDATGVVKVKIYSTKNGTYTVEAKANDKSSGLVSLVFGENGVTALEMTTAQDQKLAQSVVDEYIQFKLYDGLGNAVKVASYDVPGTTYTVDKVVGQVNGIATNKVTAEIIDSPSGSTVKVKLGKSSSGNLRVYMDELKKEGSYLLRVSLENGKKVDVKFTVVKQGTITKLNFAYDEVNVPYGTTTVATASVADGLTLERVDAAGVKKKVALTDSNIVFTSSDTDLISVTNGGVLTTKTDDKAVGKKATITVIDKFNNLSASTEVVVGGKLAGIKLGEVKSAKVGSNAPVSVSFIDSAGNVLSAATTNDVSATGIVLEKPAGAIVGFNTSGGFSGDMKAYGKADVDVTSNVAGTVKVQILITEGTKSYSAITSINFGAADVVAAKALVLTIGSTTGFMNNNAVSSDLAPFIKDGRAFVPVSFIAAQLGGTAEFTKNAAGLVDTVTVKSGTTTVTMTIGSTTIKVVKDGKESTVTSDVAPFIKSGRTVLPFRAIAEAMGANVSFGPETGAVQWVKFAM